MLHLQKILYIFTSWYYYQKGNHFIKCGISILGQQPTQRKNMYSINECIFCRKPFEYKLADTANCYLVYHKSFLGKLYYNISTSTLFFGDLPELDLGTESLLLTLPRCKKCKKVHNSISMFDFRTKKESKEKIEKRIQLYLTNGYKLESFSIDKWADFLVEQHEKRIKEGHKPNINFPILEKDDLERFSILLSLISMIFKLYSYTSKKSFNSLSKYLKDILGIPEHEVFIIYNYFLIQFTIKDNFEMVIEKVTVMNFEKSLLINTIKYLIHLIEINKVDIKNRIELILYLEDIFKLHIKDLDKYRIEIEVELSESEAKELKKIFRATARMCHPDAVSEKMKNHAHKIMSELNNAYAQKNISKVKELYIQVQKNSKLQS